jgi:hypothetical protein
VELVLDSNRNALLALDLKVGIPDSKCQYLSHAHIKSGLDWDNGYRVRSSRRRFVRHERAFLT